ncbi:hypothetical protein SO802_011519 [Lithocarpus litseifolius]|uniref:Uncharacterized protein n=1 Tax=Lithocarpus litseifolius TaxID=425828 RepID=A0AAW2D2K2_9ROSI
MEGVRKRFASVSRSHVMSLRNELSAVKKGTDTIDGYFQKIKQIQDKLAVVSIFLDDEELLHIALGGLPTKYDSFSSGIRTRSDVLSIEELKTLLNAKEREIKKRSNNIPSASMAMNVNFQSQNHVFSNQRGREGIILIQGNLFSHKALKDLQASLHLIEYLVKSVTHSALDCYHKMDFVYQGRHSPAKLASMVANSSQVHGCNGWLIDTSCSNHVTPNLSQLSLHQQPIVGNETLQ